MRRLPGTGFCGDGVINGQEACDGSDFGGASCQSETMGGAIGGTLLCTSRCTLDLSGCRFGGVGGYGGISGMFGVGGAMGGRGAGGTASSGGSPFGGAVGTDAGSIGDPHVRTLDGLKYDFQAVGEFILIEDEDDSAFVVQVRQAPFLGLSTMSVNTAVAASVAGDRVAFYAGAEPPVRINGVPGKIESREALAHGGTIANDHGTYVVTWPTLEELEVVTTWRSLVNVSYRPSSNRPRRRVRGLLGTHDGRTDNELTLRTGKALPSAPRPEDLYGVFGRSYRIRQAESLFDYSPGESTATFTDSSFPLLHGTPPHPPTAEIARAQGVCAAAGVTDPNALEACAVDVAVTGDVGFARAAASHARSRRRGNDDVDRRKCAE